MVSSSSISLLKWVSSTDKSPPISILTCQIFLVFSMYIGISFPSAPCATSDREPFPLTALGLTSQETEKADGFPDSVSW